MKPENYSERSTRIEGWPVKITSYKLGRSFYCTVDNVSPGAWLARKKGNTLEEAEQEAIKQATELLVRTRRHVA